MQPMTFEQAFERAFKPLQEIYGHQLTEDILRIYFRHLKSRLNAEQLAKACVHVLDNFKPTGSVKFPTPAHFVEYATGSTEEKASQAVARVIGASRKIGPNSSVNFGDRALHRTIERFGGWEEMRDFDWQYRETNFKKAYIAELNAGESFGPEYLEGCHEKTNRLTQHAWTRGTPRPLLIAQVGQQGEETERLPPPVRDLPRVAGPVEPGNASALVDDLAKRMGIA